MTKQELRQYIRMQKKPHLTGAQFHCETITRHPRIVASQTVLAYSALPDEVPTLELLDQLAEQGKTVLLPHVVSDTDMILRHYTSKHNLQEGAYGILEPTGELFTDYTAIDVAIVPGMAFDTKGHRLGRGKGYYDRFLARVPYIYKLGVCFSWQMVTHVPYDDHDIVMNEIIRI